MDMGPNEKYFKHVKQTSREEEENQLSAGRGRREQAKEMVIPQCKYPIWLSHSKFT